MFDNLEPVIPLKRQRIAGAQHAVPLHAELSLQQEVVSDHA